MSWNQLFIEVPEALRDAVIGELSELGAVGVWENGELLTVYFDRSPNMDAVAEALRQLYERSGIPGEARLRSASVEDRDWGEEWKKSWSSFPMGSRFFVIPSWLSPEIPVGRFPLYIDPGQAFGTGTHETTQLTLESLERRFVAGRRVLDLGTGSGILAIAAVLMGAGQVDACDNDPLAVEIAAENIERNVPGRVALRCGSVDDVPSSSVDLLLCNLTDDVITALFLDIDRIQGENAIAIFSGILLTQAAGIRDLLQTSGYAVLEENSRGEWFCIASRKNGR